MSFQRERPPIIHATQATPLPGDVDPVDIASRLMAGETLLLQRHYAQGVRTLAALRSAICTPRSDFAKRTAEGRQFDDVAQRLLVSVSDHRVKLTDVPVIGFLPELYPETPDFFMPLVWVQALHGAWDRYQAGLHFPVLGRRLHPHYGVYAPTRMTHLELFATWLSRAEFAKGLAVDVGTGCGVLALMLSRRGFERVVATDVNPNALVGLERDLKRRPSPAQFTLKHGDLLCDQEGPVDLVVFNPPWTQGEVRSTIDQALLYEAGLFERFFDQCANCLGPDGRVAIIFSTISRLVQPQIAHPIEAELARGRFTLDERLQRKVKAAPGRRTRERVEVWVLKRA